MEFDVLKLLPKARGDEITREAIYGEYRVKSGLAKNLLDCRSKIEREEILAALRAQVFAQETVLEAMADVISIAKARLNDPSRPLGSLLLLGPTGVGKTQSAKALAAYLFGDASRLIRFDMNEFVSPESVARLVGTFDHPEGLLAGAVRRQPFAAVLFDEIEKAHPGVFDLLLQILGEARLTDALGRTTDFSNTVILLTSNLGTEQAGREIGFAERGPGEAVYLRAVRDFFRPEFFNRLDRIVPFARLDRGSLHAIAAQVTGDLLRREGLLCRRCTVEIRPEVLQWVVERGFDPALGARAMKRSVEKEVVEPIARELAALAPDRPLVIGVWRAPSAVRLRVEPLGEAAPLAEIGRPEFAADPSPWFRRAGEALARIAARCQRHRPSPADAPLYAWHLGVVQMLDDLRSLRERIVEELGAARGRRRQVLDSPAPLQRKNKNCERHWRCRLNPQRQYLRELTAAQDIRAYLRELAAEPGRARAGRWPPEVRGFPDRLALLEALAPGAEGWSWQSAALVVRSVEHCPQYRAALLKYIEREYRFSVGDETIQAFDFGLETARLRSRPALPADADEPAETWAEALFPAEKRAELEARHRIKILLFEGPRAWDLLRLHEGTHLVSGDDDRPQPLRVELVRLAPGADPKAALRDYLEAYDRAADPPPWSPVVAVYERDGLRLEPVLDYLTGQIGREAGWGRRLSMMLPLPPELRDA